jgi:formylglycine-generating enzyme required for sulfatase activity
LNTLIRSILVLLAILIVPAVFAQGLFKGFTADPNGYRLDESLPIQQPGIAPGTLIKDCPQCPEMVVVPAGSFTMGSSAQEQALAIAAGMRAENLPTEGPQHYVHVPSFAAGRYAVSQSEFARFIRASGYVTHAERESGCFVWAGEDGKHNRADLQVRWNQADFYQEGDHPVVCVSWNDAQAYIQWLSQGTGKRYRLFTEAEREYAARGGTASSFWFGETIRTLQANYNGARASYNQSPQGERRQATVSVRSFSPNPFGLYGVHGNVWDWVEDCFHKNYEGAPANGSAWTKDCAGDNEKIVRGGSWYNAPFSLRAASRGWVNGNIPMHHIGFRIARDL